MKPLISVIVTTKNEEKNLPNCLTSIKIQSYKNVEIIVVDNNSTDKTKKIASKYTPCVFNKGPERSAQRNYGAKKAHGKYILFLDADMVLTKRVIEKSVVRIQESGVGGIIIPEESYGVGFWAQCKKLERSFYIGNDQLEAARFFKRKYVLQLGGFDETLTGPEDWDFSQRVKENYGITRTNSKIMHNEGKLSLLNTVRKKYYYSHKFKMYLMKKENKSYSDKQFSIINRYWVFFSQPKKLFRNPVLGIGVLFMKTCEFISGGIGYIRK